MNGLPFTNAIGEPDFLIFDELQAVECTGRSSCHEYGMTAMEWPERISIMSAARLVHCRPGAVAQGKRPAHVEAVPMNRHGLPHLGAYCYLYHFADSWTCQVMSRPGLNVNAMLDREQFQKAMRLGVACSYCVKGLQTDTHAA
jgi:hypothetical protein